MCAGTQRFQLGRVVPKPGRVYEMAWMGGLRYENVDNTNGNERTNRTDCFTSKLCTRIAITEYYAKLVYWGVRE